MALRRQKGRLSPQLGRQVLRDGREAGLRSLLGVCAFVVAGLWIFLPALHGGWLWDDGAYIGDNALVHSPDGYWKAWVNLNPLGENIPGNFNPLTTVTEWLEWQIWGNETFPYHLVSVALHVTSALLLWKLLSRLRFSFAWLGAFIFLTQPLMVESVAWISELKNTLALPPLLLAMLAWLDYDEQGGTKNYRSALLWFALSLAAKSSGLMLPFILLGYAWWKRGAISARDFKLSAPFFGVSAVTGLITLLPPHLTGSHMVALPSWGPVAALASVGWTVLFLLGKCFFPIGLLPDYPGFSITQPTAYDSLPWLLFAVTSLVLGIGWRRAAWVRPMVLGLGFFLVNLVPVLIYVFKTYPQMAWSLDHLVYLPIIGLIGWSLAWLEELHQRMPSSARAFAYGIIGVILMAYCWGSHAYARVFVDQDQFWAYMLAKEPQNWRIHDNYGDMKKDEGNYPEALDQLRKAIALQPDAEQAQYDLAMALEAVGKDDEAREHFLQAAKANPHEMRSYLALSEMMRKKGDFQEAETYISQARLAAPNDSKPIAALAGLYVQTGRTTEGLALYEQALTMTPDILAERYNYGVALLHAGQSEKAAEQLRMAVELDGNFVPGRENLGVALAQTGAIPDAIEQFEAVLKINSANVAARDNLGLAFAQTGQLPEAIEQFQKALQSNPQDAKARDSLGKLLSLQSTTPEKNPH